MEKWNLIIDVAECTNCNNCLLACKDEYVGNDFPGYSAPQPLHGHKWFYIESREHGQYPMVDVAYRPTTCNHCNDAPCVRKSTDGTVYQRPDGIVMIDPDKARGKPDIVNTCPYGAIWWNEEEQVAQKWNFDAHLLDRGEPRLRCEQVCPTGVFRSLKVEDDQMNRIIEDEELQVLNPEFKANPRVYYKNLDNFTKYFIGGTLLAVKDGVMDAASGVEIELTQGGVTLQTGESNEYGDFKFSGLNVDSGNFTLQFHSTEHGDFEITTELTQSTYLGTLTLPSPSH